LAGPHNFERLVALKVVHDHLSEEREFISQFLDEANLLVRLNHPNIVQVHELGREGHTLFLAIEYLDGQPLSKIVQKLADQNARLPPELVAWIGARVADGLAYAHDLSDDEGNSLGLVHRDISPQNIFVTYDGGVKIIDFGIARAAGRLSQTTLGKIKGKFSYMAPEQVLGSEFDHRADLFALGATLYECAIGARLFKGKDETDTLHKLLFEDVPDPRTRVPGFPDALALSLRRALEAKPEDRYPSGAPFREDLEAFLAETAPGVDQRDQLAALLRRLFEAARKRQNASIEEMRAAPGALGSDSVVVTEPAAVAVQSKRGRTLALATAGFVVLVGVVAFAVTRGDPAPPAAPSAAGLAAPVAANVNIEVELQPAVDGARVEIDGKRASGKPARATVPRGDAPLLIRVSADGKHPAELSIVPDKDRSVVVPLSDVPAAPAPSASAAKKPVTTGGAPVVKPTDGQKKPGDLVTEYPFE
jgi:serine/threonine-protein kinase